MDKRNVITGIDIGTYHVKTVISRCPKPNERNLPVILGRGMSESKGMRYGYIVNPGDASRSIRTAVGQAEEMAGVHIRQAFISIGGIELSGITTQASIVVSRADSQITELDLEKVHEACKNDIPPQDKLNRRILHEIPIAYRVDGKRVFGDPLKMKGIKLEARMLFVTCLEQHLVDLIESVESNGVDVIDVIAAPIAAGYVTLSKQQRTAGCVLANIGAETVSIVVYEDNIPISLEIFPVGSTNITNDIALNFQISLEEAEQLKVGKIRNVNYPQKKLDEIIKNRLIDMFALIEAHLKKIGRDRLLPAGIVITGGGSGIGTIEDIARGALELPSSIGSLPIHPNNGKRTNVVKDSTWSVAYGLCVFGYQYGQITSGGALKIMSRMIRSLQNIFRQILP